MLTSLNRSTSSLLRGRFPMWQSLTLLLRVFSGMVEFQPHVWTLPYSDLKTCHFVLSAASLVLPFFMEQVIIRLTKWSKLWCHGLRPRWRTLKQLLHTLGHCLTLAFIERTQPTNVRDRKIRVFQRSDCYLTLFRGTSCANDL